MNYKPLIVMLVGLVLYFIPPAVFSVVFHAPFFAIMWLFPFGVGVSAAGMMYLDEEL